jgi:hypothetical protein
MQFPGKVSVLSGSAKEFTTLCEEGLYGSHMFQSIWIQGSDITRSQHMQPGPVSGGWTKPVIDSALCFCPSLRWYDLLLAWEHEVSNHHDVLHCECSFLNFCWGHIKPSLSPWTTVICHPPRSCDKVSQDSLSYEYSLVSVSQTILLLKH